MVNETIKSIEVIPVRIPLKKPAESAHGITVDQESIVVRIFSSEGHEGIGSVEPCEGYDEETAEEIAQTVRDILSPVLIGQNPFQIKRLLSLMDQATEKHLGSKGLIEMALFDLMGKSLNVPVHLFFGGKVKDVVSLNGWVGLVSPDKARDEVREWLSRGFRSVKVKVNSDLDAAVGRVRAVCSEVGDRMEIRVDANESLTTDSALAFIKGLDNSNVLYLEQPTPRHDLDSFGIISRSSSMKLMADEGIWDFETLLRILQSGASDFVKVKVQKFGGMWKTHQAIQLAESFGIPVILGHGFGLSINTMSEIHLAACSHAVCEGCESVGPLKMSDDVVTQAAMMDKGVIAVPSAPGLGVVIDEAKLKQYRYD